MANIENEEKTVDSTETTTEDQTPANESPDLQAEIDKLNAENGGLRRDLKKATKAPETVEKEDGESDGLDYGQLAFLKQSGVDTSSDAQLELVENLTKTSGKELKDLLDDGYFKSELKSLQDSEANEAALPDGSKRSGQSTANTAEYWVAKGGLPENTPANKKLRQEIVNLRSNNTEGGTQFTDNPVV